MVTLVTSRTPAVIFGGRFIAQIHNCYGAMHVASVGFGDAIHSAEYICVRKPI